MDELLKDFIDESSEQLEAIDAHLSRFEREPSDTRIVANIFRLVHVIKNGCGLLNLRRLEKVASSTETLIRQLHGGSAPNGEDVALIIATVDRIKFILGSVAQGRGEPPGDDDKLIARIESAALSQPNRSRRPAAGAHDRWQSELGSRTTPPERRADSVRVSLETLESLTSLVCELELTRNQLISAADAAGSGPLHKPLRRLLAVTAGLQSGVRAARVLPIEKLFANLHRLVRDFSAEMGKKVDLTVRGGETEIDRQLIDALRDPLAHTIRRAIEHDIESPAARDRLGKPEVASIEVSVLCRDGILFIEVADDGRGPEFDVMRECLRDGAREECAALRGSDIGRSDVAPGLCRSRRLDGGSCPDAGLEILRSQVERMGGSTSFANRPGCGSTVGLQFPLGAATIPVFLLKAGHDCFALPQHFVEEILELDPIDGVLIDVRGELALVTEGGILPAADLRALMKSSTSEKACRPLRVALKLRVGQVLFALVVDEMLEAQQIELKSLPTPLRTFAAFSGAGLLGNGSVVLGLDPSGLLNAIGASQHKLARGAEIRQQLTNIVLFRSYGSALRGFPASAVARIVQLGPAQIEIVDGERVFRANHRLIPLAGMESRSSQADPDARSFPTLLLEQDGGSLGLMVDEVVDVIEAEVIVDRAGLGSATLGGATIEVLDPLVFFSRSRKAKRAAILIVEPSGLVQKMLAELLSQNGYQASAVGDVGVALAALLEEERFAVALVDVGVAVAQASEISGRLKHAGVGSPPVLIGLASHGGPSMRAKAKTAGLSTAVGKFDRASLLSALHSTLGEAEMAA